MAESPFELSTPPPDDGLKPAHLLLVGALCVVLYLAGNGRISLWDRDEPRYAQCAREMLDRGDFIVPTFNAEPRFHKPVFIYWLMALAYTIFGDNEFGARFFSAIAGTVTCLLTYRLGCRMGGRSVGLGAALMLAVAPLMIVESKLATTDAVLTAALMGAMSCLWDLHDVGLSWSRSLTFWLLVGVSILTKGPVGLGIIATGMLVWLLLCRRRHLLARMNWLAGLAVLAVVTLPWAIAVYWATDGEFYREAIGKHVISRSLEPMEGHRGFPGYYLATAMVGLLPWSLVLPLGLCGVRRWARGDGPGSFLLGWMIGPMILLEVVSTKLPHYYLPAYPAWAILIARGLVEFHTAGERLVRCRAGWPRIALPAFLCAGVALALAGVAIVKWPRELAAPAVVFAVILGVGTTLAAHQLVRSRDFAAWKSLVVTWGLLGFVSGSWLVPAAEVGRTERAAALALGRQATDEIPAALVVFREPSLVFYLGRPVPMLVAIKELDGYLREHGPVITLLREQELSKLRKQPSVEVEICQRIERQRLDPIPTQSVVIARLRASEHNSEITAAAEHHDVRQ